MLIAIPVVFSITPEICKERFTVSCIKIEGNQAKSLQFHFVFPDFRCQRVNGVFIWVVFYILKKNRNLRSKVVKVVITSFPNIACKKFRNSIQQVFYWCTWVISLVSNVPMLLWHFFMLGEQRKVNGTQLNVTHIFDSHQKVTFLVSNTE